MDREPEIAVSDELLERLAVQYGKRLCAKVRYIAGLLRLDATRDFSKNPIAVEDIAVILAADLSFQPHMTKDGFYWQGNTEEARLLNAQLMIMTYWEGGDF